MCLNFRRRQTRVTVRKSRPIRAYKAVANGDLPLIGSLPLGEDGRHSRYSYGAVYQSQDHYSYPRRTAKPPETWNEVGFYCFKSRLNAINYAKRYGGERVRQVYLWGAVVRHQDPAAYRAEYIRVGRVVWRWRRR